MSTLTVRPKFAREIPLKSSVVKSVRFDQENLVLDVTLNSGNRYRYRHINSWTFTQLVAGKSPGKVFNTIKANPWHKARKLPSLRK